MMNLRGHRGPCSDQDQSQHRGSEPHLRSSAGVRALTDGSKMRFLPRKRVSSIDLASATILQSVIPIRNRPNLAAGSVDLIRLTRTLQYNGSATRRRCGWGSRIRGYGRRVFRTGDLARKRRIVWAGCLYGATGWECWRLRDLADGRRRVPDHRIGSCVVTIGHLGIGDARSHKCSDRTQDNDILQVESLHGDHSLTRYDMEPEACPPVRKSVSSGVSVRARRHTE